jgi:hypothetical protein
MALRARAITCGHGGLLTLCDRFEASLTTADEAHHGLLEALRGEALAAAEQRKLEAEE